MHGDWSFAGHLAGAALNHSVQVSCHLCSQLFAFLAQGSDFMAQDATCVILRHMATHPRKRKKQGPSRRCLSAPSHTRDENSRRQRCSGCAIVMMSARKSFVVTWPGTFTSTQPEKRCLHQRIQLSTRLRRTSPPGPNAATATEANHPILHTPMAFAR